MAGTEENSSVSDDKNTPRARFYKLHVSGESFNSDNNNIISGFLFVCLKLISSC